MEEYLNIHTRLGGDQLARLRLDSEVGCQVSHPGTCTLQHQSGEKGKEWRSLQLQVEVLPAQPGLCIGPEKEEKGECSSAQGILDADREHRQS